MNTLKTKAISCAAALLLTALSSTPAAAFQLYLQTGDGSGSATGFTTQWECESSGSSCGLFGSNCAGIDVWVAFGRTMDRLNETYYNGSRVSVHPASDITSKYCHYQK